jgi:hypothetical protein
MIQEILLIFIIFLIIVIYNETKNIMTYNLNTIKLAIFFIAFKAYGGTAFIWIFANLSSVLYFPLALWTLISLKPEFGLYQITLILASAVQHSLYFILLDKGYRVGDLSFIYP